MWVGPPAVLVAPSIPCPARQRGLLALAMAEPLALADWENSSLVIDLQQMITKNGGLPGGLTICWTVSAWIFMFVSSWWIIEKEKIMWYGVVSLFAVVGVVFLGGSSLHMSHLVVGESPPKLLGHNADEASPLTHRCQSSPTGMALKNHQHEHGHIKSGQTCVWRQHGSLFETCVCIKDSQLIS